MLRDSWALWAKANNNPADAAKKLVATYAAEGIKVTEAQAQAKSTPGSLQTWTASNLNSNQRLEEFRRWRLASTSLWSSWSPAGVLRRRIGRPHTSSILDFIAGDAELRSIAEGKK